MQDLVIEPDPEVTLPDTPPDAQTLFDPDETLPYFLGDDPELLEDDNQFDYFQQSDSHVPTEITSQEAIDLDPLSTQETQHEPSAVPRTSQKGREIKMPARFKN